MSRARACGHCEGSHTGVFDIRATAVTAARGWLLIEHPGPWGERIETMNLPPAVHDLVRHALALGIRPQFIRRPGRRRRTPPLQVFVAWSQGRDVWAEHREVTDLAELARLDLATLARGGRPGFGRPHTEPLLLVCAHGRHNACCARTGGPLARHLRDRFGAPVWETTHVGGDRYAANLVCLPHGLYYGELDRATADAAATAYLAGEVVLERLRGRAGLPEPAQAAAHRVREITGALGIDAVSVESITGAPVFEVVIDVAGTRYRVDVEPSAAAHSCGADCNEDVRSYRLGDLTLLNEAALV